MEKTIQIRFGLWSLLSSFPLTALLPEHHSGTRSRKEHSQMGLFHKKLFLCNLSLFPLWSTPNHGVRQKPLFHEDVHHCWSYTATSTGWQSAKDHHKIVKSLEPIMSLLICIQKIPSVWSDITFCSSNSPNSFISTNIFPDVLWSHPLLMSPRPCLLSKSNFIASLQLPDFTFVRNGFFTFALFLSLILFPVTTSS